MDGLRLCRLMFLTRGCTIGLILSRFCDCSLLRDCSLLKFSFCFWKPNICCSLYLGETCGLFLTTSLFGWGNYWEFSVLIREPELMEFGVEITSSCVG